MQTYIALPIETFQSKQRNLKESEPVTPPTCPAEECQPPGRALLTLPSAISTGHGENRHCGLQSAKPIGRMSAQSTKNQLHKKCLRMLQINYTTDELEHSRCILINKEVHILYKNSCCIYKILTVNQTKKKSRNSTKHSMVN